MGAMGYEEVVRLKKERVAKARELKALRKKLSDKNALDASKEEYEREAAGLQKEIERIDGLLLPSWVEGGSAS